MRNSPDLRFIWSLSPANSAEYFVELKVTLCILVIKKTIIFQLTEPEPDLEKAISLKSDELGESKNFRSYQENYGLDRLQSF